MTRRTMTSGAIVAVVALLAVPLALLAHAHLRRSEPAALERLQMAPRAIRLWFSERPQLAFTRITLRGSDGRDVRLDSVASIDNDAFGVAARVPLALPNDTYTVLWQTGGADGHPSRGSYQFTLAAPATVARDAAAPTPVTNGDTAERRRGRHALIRVDRRGADGLGLDGFVATRWAEFVATLAVVGAVVFQAILMSGVVSRNAQMSVNPGVLTRLSDSTRHFAQGSLALSLGAALVRLYGEAALVVGSQGAVDIATVRTIVLDTTWGWGWAFGVAGIVAAAIGLSFARRSRGGWWVAGVGACALTMTPALTGHAAATAPVPLAVAVDVLHVIGAGVWIGTLLVVVVVGIPALRAGPDATASVGSLVRAFHPIALVGGAMVIVSGVLASVLRIPSLPALWQTPYGRVILLKIALVAGVVLLGAFNWRRLLPRLSDSGVSGILRRTAGAELAIAAIVLVVTALLVSMPTPDHQGAVPGASTASTAPTPLSDAREP